MATFLASIDQGTTSTRAIIFSRSGQPVAVHQVDLPQHYPQPGWHEHDPSDLVSTAVACLAGAVEKFTTAGHDVDSIIGLGITNQRETMIGWDVDTGEAVYNAIVWTDSRSSSIVAYLKSKLPPKQTKSSVSAGTPPPSGMFDAEIASGLRLSTYPTGPKLKWLIENVPAARSRYLDGKLAIGTVDSWLIYNLTNRTVFATDPSNASRTMLMDIQSLSWSAKLAEFFNLDLSLLKLPTIMPSGHPTGFGVVASGLPLQGTPITGVLGDQSAALVGHLGFTAGSVKMTYGTGGFLLAHIGPITTLCQTPSLLSSVQTSGLVWTIGYHFPSFGPAISAIEGSIPAAGSAIDFLIQTTSPDCTAQQLCAKASSVTDTAGVTFITALSSVLFAPFWTDKLSGTITGLSARTKPGHIVRACLEATAIQTRLILDAITASVGSTLDKITELSVDGGLSRSDDMLQIQADIGQVQVRRRGGTAEATALGAAIAAGIGAGLWETAEDVRRDITSTETSDLNSNAVFDPSIKAETAADRTENWTRTVEQLLK